MTAVCEGVEEIAAMNGVCSCEQEELRSMVWLAAKAADPQLLQVQLQRAARAKVNRICGSSTMHARSSSNAGCSKSQACSRWK